jgi:hypothetical protein
MSTTRVTGSLITVKRQTGSIYFMKARDKSGRQIKLKLGPVADYTRKQAQDALRDWLTDLGRTPGHGDHTVTFEYAAGVWLSYVEHERGRTPSTIRDYRNTVARHLIPRFAETPLAQITVGDIERLRSELLGKLAPRTAQKMLGGRGAVGRSCAHDRAGRRADPDRRVHRPTTRRGACAALA